MIVRLLILVSLSAACGLVAISGYLRPAQFHGQVSIEPPPPVVGPSTPESREEYDKLIAAKREEALGIFQKSNAGEPSRPKEASASRRRDDEKCDKRGMKIFPAGYYAASSQDTCCYGKSPRIGMTFAEVQSTCWPRPTEERRYTSAAGTTVVRRYGVITVNGPRKELTFFNDILTSIFE